MSFNILDPNISINDHLIIEASAGTGKTFTIEHLFVRRCLEKASDGSLWSVKDFAVITFTRACASELVVRIRKALDDAQDILQGKLRPSFVPPYLAKILSCGEENVRTSLQRLWEAKSALDLCLISTIHGFCLQVLIEYTKEDTLFSHKMWASQEEIARIVHDIIAYDLPDSIISDFQLHLLFKEYQYDMPLFLQDVCKRIWDKKEEMPFLQRADIQKEIKEKAASLRSSFGYSNEKVVTLLEQIADGFTGLKDKNGILKREKREQFELFSSLFNENIFEENFEPLLSSPLIFSEVFSSPKAKSSLERDSEPFRLLEIGKKIFDPLIKAISSPSILIDTLVQYIRPQCINMLRRKNLLTFEDLIERVCELLKENTFKQFLQKRFRVCIVDEFQDTDPSQWQILSSFLEGNGCIYLVGDPKQAIYAFRRADVYSYLNAKMELTEKKVGSLTKNFRSSAHLVDAHNALFYGPQSSFLFHLPKSNSSLAVHKIESALSVENFETSDGKKALHFFVARGALGRKRNFPTEEVEETYFFPFIAEEIMHLQNRSIPIEKMAILVRDRYQAARVEAFLKDVGILAISWRMHSVTETKAYTMLKRVTQVLFHPRDRGFLVELLSFAPFSYSEKTCSLFHSAAEEGLFLWAAFVEKICFLRSEFERKGIGALFRSFLDLVLPEKEETVQQAIENMGDGEEFLRDLNHLFDILVSVEHEFLGSVEKLQHVVHDLGETAHDRDEYPARFDLQQKAVNILTIHRSKGLEFDVVFALGVCSRCRKDHEETIPFLCEQDQEKIRQFYVACTRAKKRLYIPIAIDTDQKPLSVGTASPVELFCGYFEYAHKKDEKKLFEEVYKEIHTTFSEKVIVDALNILEKASSHISISDLLPRFLPSRLCPRPKVYASTLPSPRLIFRTKDITSFSRMKKEKYEESFFTANKEWDASVLDCLPQGVPTGLALHALLKKFFRGKHLFSDEKQFGTWIQKEISHTHLAGHKETVTLILQRLLKASFVVPSSSFSLADLDFEKTFCEMDFLSFEKYYESRASETFLKGSIDFACTYGGKYYVIDWKTNFLGNSLKEYETPLLLNAVYENRYDLQAKIYTKAFKKYLMGFGKEYEVSFGGVFFVFLRAFAYPESYSTPHGILFLDTSMQKEEVLV